MLDTQESKVVRGGPGVLFPVDSRFLEHGLCLLTTVLLVGMSWNVSSDHAVSLLLVWMTVFAVLVEEYLVVPYGSRSMCVHRPRHALSHGLATGSSVLPWVLWTGVGEGDGDMGVRAVLGSLAILLFICVQYCYDARGRTVRKRVAGIVCLLYLVLDLYGNKGWQGGSIASSVIRLCCFDGIIKYIPHTFTLGESIALSSAIVHVLWNTCMMYVVTGEAMENPNISTFVQSTISVGVLCFGISFTACTIQKNRGTSRNSRVFRVLGWGATVAGMMMLCLGGYIIGTVIPMANVFAGDGYDQNITRAVLVFYWFIVLIVSLPAMNMLKTHGNMIPNIILRKGFHLVAVMLFVPPLILDPGLLAVALATALLGFLAVEVIRIGNIRIPLDIDEHVHRFMALFIDSRDHGTLYMTHLTLLLGLAVPIWLSQSHHDHRYHNKNSSLKPILNGKYVNSRDTMILSFAGIIATGVGDAVASIIGTLYGTMRLSHTTPKTVQGTCASIVSMMGCWYVVDSLALLGTPRSATEWMMLCVVTTASGLFESITDQFDNVFVSVHYYALLQSILTMESRS